MSVAKPPNFPRADAEAATTDFELPAHLLAKLRIGIPGYALLEKIDAGGQATVYRAREATSGLTVAIKVLNGGPNAGPVARERLRRETAALRAINHPNIVCVIESGRTSMGLDYLVMNYIDGRPLDALWRDHRFAARVAPEPPARLRLFKRICDVVRAAHLKGITHRDLSPSNILITADGDPHVLDFGLASSGRQRKERSKPTDLIYKGSLPKDFEKKLPVNADDLKKSLKLNDWNEGVIVANGNHMTFSINGQLMTELIDESPTAPSTGVIALQLHVGFTMEVQFKDIKICKRD